MNPIDLDPVVHLTRIPDPGGSGPAQRRSSEGPGRANDVFLPGCRGLPASWKRSPAPSSGSRQHTHPTGWHRNRDTRKASCRQPFSRSEPATDHADHARSYLRCPSPGCQGQSAGLCR